MPRHPPEKGGGRKKGIFLIVGRFGCVNPRIIGEGRRRHASVDDMSITCPDVSEGKGAQPKSGPTLVKK